MISVNPNDYVGTDSERIEQAVNVSHKNGGIVTIPARKSDAVSERNYWVLDRAILLPGDTTLILENCKLKLSDRSRDNFIRSSNCGEGVSDVRSLSNIHIIGVGSVVLEGADHPRSTGDHAKTLGTQTYGTDAGKEGCKQTGDWRNIGVLLSSVQNFSIQNITLKDYHAWGVSLEYCFYGNVKNLHFSAGNGKLIDGKFETILNQDGLDIRRGCHDITIDGITGVSGDDLVALTAIYPQKVISSGDLNSTQVSSMPAKGKTDDLYNIIIRNVMGYCAGRHSIIRFLNASGIKMYNIVLDGVVDTSPEGLNCISTIRIGDNNPVWGGIAPLGDTSAFTINNVNGKGQHCIKIFGSLTNSTINNIVAHLPASEPVTYNQQYVKNIVVNNAIVIQ